MKRRTPGGIWVIRGVSLALVLVILGVIGTIGYSAYEVYSGVSAAFSGGSHPITGQTVIQGQSAVFTLNVTLPNRGLYPLNLSMACDSPPSGIDCAPAQVVIPPGQTGELSFSMTIADYQAFQASSLQSVNATVTIGLEPFVSLSVGVDLGSLATQGGGQ